MSLDAFFGVVATIDFALLGFWWIAVLGRADLRDRRSGASRMSYLVSLQFIMPGTGALLAQVAPGLQGVWRVSFALCAATGVAAILTIAPALANAGAREVGRFLWLVALPLNLLITLIALVPQILGSIAGNLSALQVEAILFCLTVFVGSQTAWAAAMAPNLSNDHKGEQTLAEN
jgi:hypothetical protein